MKELVLNGIVEIDQLKQLVTDIYKPSLTLIDYTLNDNGITLFTHAPAALEAIKNTAAKLGVLYKDTTKEELATTIEKINIKFKQLVDNNQINSLTKIQNVDVSLDAMSPTQRKDHPLVYLIWNRWTDAMDNDETLRPAIHNGYAITYVHGHDDHQTNHPHIINLDTNSGKYLPLHTKEPSRYKTVNSDEITLPDCCFTLEAISEEFTNDLLLAGLNEIIKLTSIGEHNLNNAVFGNRRETARNFLQACSKFLDRNFLLFQHTIIGDKFEKNDFLGRVNELITLVQRAENLGGNTSLTFHKQDRNNNSLQAADLLKILNKFIISNNLPDIEDEDGFVILPLMTS